MYIHFVRGISKIQICDREGFCKHVANSCMPRTGETGYQWFPTLPRLTGPFCACQLVLRLFTRLHKLSELLIIASCKSSVALSCAVLRFRPQRPVFTGFVSWRNIWFIRSRARRSASAAPKAVLLNNYLAATSI
jgi:hypothetical protein